MRTTFLWASLVFGMAVIAPTIGMSSASAQTTQSPLAYVRLDCRPPSNSILQAETTTRREMSLGLVPSPMKFFGRVIHSETNVTLTVRLVDLRSGLIMFSSLSSGDKSAGPSIVGNV
jgi:hypothetical protein